MPGVRASRRTLLIVGVCVLAVVPVVAAGWFYHNRPVTVTDERLGVTVRTTNDALDGGTVTVTPTDTSGVTFDGFARPVNRPVLIEVDGGRLTGDATVTFTIPDGADPEAVSIFTADTENRPVLVGGRVDAKARTITATVGHFSQWWLSEWELEEVYGEDWAVQMRNDALTRTVGRILQIPPPLACDRPALAVEIEVSTFGERVDVCPIYDAEGRLAISIGNGIGAPLLITTGPGLRYGSTDPPGETVFNSMVRILRTELGDEQVAVGGGRRVTFIVEPDKVVDNQVHLKAELNIGYAALDFSGGLLDLLVPHLSADVALEAAVKRANDYAKYAECMVKGAQDIGRTGFADSAALFTALALTYSRCERNLFDLLHRLLTDPAKVVQDWVKKQAGNAVLNNLPQHVSRLIKRMMGILPHLGAVLTQPLFTAVAAAQSDGRPFELRLTVTEPPLNRLHQVLPTPGEANYTADPDLAGFRSSARRYGVTIPTDALPTTGDPCVDRAPVNQPWNSATWLHPTFAADGYRLTGAAAAQVHSDVHLAYVPPEHRKAVAGYMQSWYGATSCETSVDGYDVRTAAVGSVHVDDEVVARYVWSGYPDSDVINESWTVTAYDPAKGYLLVVSASPGTRGEQFYPEVDDTTMVRVLDTAYRLAATKANSMLGARFHVV